MKDLAINLSESPKPPFAIVAPKIFGLQNVAQKNSDHIDKVDTVLDEIGLSLLVVPFEFHAQVLTYVLTT
ncbi:MAG TPA: hypothetical protein VHY35_14980 [Stellaceae bacterium]|jgi:hypothetical protein|nr:hypothetical protein [Stellaceae bacterium]